MVQTIPVLVFFFVFLACLGIYFFYQDRQAMKKEILVKRASTAQSIKETRRIDLRRRREMSRTERLFSKLVDISLVSDLLAQSGLGISLDRFLYLSTGSAAGFALVSIVFIQSFIISCILIAAGFTLPVGFLYYKKIKRDRLIVEQFPEVIDFMVRALRSGQSLDRAFYGVSRNFADPMGGEIKIIYEEIAMGLAFSEALKNFEQRFPRIPEVRFLSSSFIIQKETGGNLTEILEGLSTTIRQRFKLERQIRASTAESRLSIVFIGLAPLGFGCASYWMRPEYISILFIEPVGRRLIFLAIMMNILGFLAMRILSRVEP